MKILQLVSCRGWSSDAYWAARMAAELTRRGHTVTVAFRAGTEDRVIERARREEGLRATVTLDLRSGLRPASDVRDVRSLSALLRDVDVIHVHRGKDHWLAAIANRVTRTPRPIVRTRHITQAVRRHAANRWLYRSSTHLAVAVTDAIRRQMIAAGLVAADRVVTLRGGADAERYRPGARDPELHRRLGGGAERVVIGMVSGLRSMKGHQLVIDAAASVTRRGVDARFAFVGRGPLESAVREAIAAHDLDGRITVAGFVEDLPAVMRALDIALYVPLESEGMSRVLFECLASGCTLVASRMGVVPEILVDEEHAMLVPAGDAPSLADRLARLVKDPDLRRRLGHAGRQLVETRYSGAQVAAALESHYDRLARGVEPPRAA